MNVKTPTPQSHSLTRVAKLYQGAIVISALLLPAAAMSYLSFFVDPARDFHSATFHEIAIAFATVGMGFLAFLSHQAYKKHRVPFFRFLTFGIIGFAAVYAPHGILTRAAQHNAVLFLVYGPVSRFTMSVYLLAALLCSTGSPVVASRKRPLSLWPHILAFGLIDASLFLLATFSLTLAPIHLRIAEGATLAVFALSLLFMLAFRIRTPLRWYYAAALSVFAQASIGFILAKPWNHLWWLAHGIFAAGSFVLGYAVALNYQRLSETDVTT